MTDFFNSMAFWKPGAAGPALERDAEGGADGTAGGGGGMVYNPHHRMSLRDQRSRLPIAASRDSFLYCMEKYRVVILCGETGSGKTTQLPQYLDEAGWTAGGRVVVCTQPRRVAAVSVASRVADEMGARLGDAVGYSVRFDHRFDPDKTRLKFVTDGTLLRETMTDPLLSKYSVLILDEAHERSLYTDVLLGLVRKILRRRPELRVVVASATLDAELFRRFFETNTKVGRW